MIEPRTVRRMLDVAEAARLLAALPREEAIAGVRIYSVWAKPGRHFNVCYQVNDGSGSHLASLCVVNATETARIVRRLGRVASGEGCFALVGADVLAQRFPLDYRLDNLAACLRPEAVRDVLGDAGVDHCEVAAYRAGMRCQIRYSAGDTVRAYGKIAFDREPGRRRHLHLRLHDATARGVMRVPPSAGTVSALGLDLVAAVGGRSLHDILASFPDAGQVRATMRALAEFHATVPAPSDRIHGSREELALVESWTNWVSILEPSLSDALGRAFALLAAQVPESVPVTCAHRDFHDKQVLVGASNVWLLDVDTACTGAAELDVGNFLAHLFLRGLQWDRVDAHRTLEDEAQSAYGTKAHPPVTRWYRRASLVRLACVYFLRPRWRHVAPQLLEEAIRP